MYEELMEMTDGFARDNIIGEGGFGCVYKGRMPDGRFVAVKRLKVGNGQGEREFKAEVEIISRIHHRHLVSLVGYCISQNQRLLIYDFVRNKTLEHHLHGKIIGYSPNKKGLNCNLDPSTILKFWIISVLYFGVIRFSAFMVSLVNLNN